MIAIVTQTRAQRGFATRSERWGARGPSQGPRVDGGWGARGLSQGPRVDGGFTLIEIMIVLAIIALMGSLGIRGFRSLARSDLRTSTTNLAGAMRFLFDRASTTGKVHRLVLDLENERYWAEVSDDKFFIPRDAESPEALRRREDLEALEDVEKRKKREEDDKIAAASASSSGASFDVAKLEAGEFKPQRARFAAFKETALKPVTLKKAVLRSVYTPRVTEPITSGRAYIYFFPLGQTEPAIVTLSDPTGETIFSLVAHPITGRVRVYNQEVKPPGGAPSDDEGNRVVEP
jgi:general secretion pathway protein H